MRVALDEQIFAIQRHGGISRLFYEQALQFLEDSDHKVDLEALQAPVVNEYLLEDAAVKSALAVRQAPGPYQALATYLSRSRRKQPVDVCHTTFYLPRGLSDYPAARHVVTVYDMIPELLPHTRRRLDFLTLKRRYITRADHVVCISESTRNDLFKLYPDLHVATTIAYPGVSSRFQPDVPKLDSAPRRYILHVGKRTSYKDGVTLVQAFASVAGSHPDVTLWLVGGGPLSREEEALITERGIPGRVFQQDLGDASMPAAYANAVVTVLPSRYEGFGLPAVEALACGSPLILARTSSLPEVGGDAAAYFSPGDMQELAHELNAVLEDSTAQAEMRSRGFERARKFTWKSFAQSNAAAYESTLA